MKIDRLDLKAYGCFTDVTLQFSEAEYGTFLIFGPNEAGKTTALNAVRQWLYEFDRNVSLDFKHKKAKQRVGGVVSANGQSLCCFRKRGNANTLLDDSEKPIGDDALRPFLQGIDETRFCSVFGINHPGLRAGGRDIAEGKGDLGQALFAAGSGLLHLDRIQKRLARAKDDLFAVRGEKPAINRSLDRCTEIAARLAQERLSLSDVKQGQENLAKLKGARDTLKEELDKLKRQCDEVDRLIRISPLVQRRKELLKSLELNRSTIRLREDFRTDFNNTDQDWTREKQTLGFLREQFSTLEEELGQIAADPEVLYAKDALEKLSKAAGMYETDYNDLPTLKSQRNQTQGEAKQKLRELGRDPNLDPELIEPLRLDEQKRDRVRALGNKRQGYVSKVDEASVSVSDLELDLGSGRAEFAKLPIPASTEGLEATLKRIAKMGDLEQECRQAVENRTECEKALNEARSRLPLWSGAADEIASAPIPSAQDIEYHRDQIEQARTTLRKTKDRASEHRDRLIELGKQLERLRHTGEVPSEQDLEADRASRQRGWRLIRSAWLDDKEDEAAERAWISSVSAEASLAEAYELAVARGDQTSDRLRREANRVSEQAGLLAEETASQQKLQEDEKKIQQAELTAGAVEEAWKTIWKPAGIEPRSPKEMREWLDQWQRLVQLAQDRQTAAKRFESKRSELQEAIRDLRSALEASAGLPSRLRPEPSLVELMEIANQQIEESRNLRQKRTNQEAEITRLTRELEKAKKKGDLAQQQYAAWEQEWDSALRFFEPPQRLLPDEANRILDIILEFWKKINDFKQRQGRIQGIEDRSGGFPPAVYDLAERLEGKRPDGEAPLRVHERLQGRLREAESNDRRRQEKDGELEQFRTKIADRCATILLLEQQLSRLCQEANVNGAEELPEAIRRSDERREFENKLQECENDVQIQGGMADLETLNRLVEEAQAQHRDFGLEKPRFEQQIEEKRAALEEVNKQIGAAEQAVQTLRARSGAGESAAELESEYARLRRLAEEYVSLVLASQALNEAIRRYREGSSTGLLSEASSIFRLLTCDSFEHLEISEDDQAKPYLIGVRPGGEEIGVEGMSDGTRDQLYLALRLAHLKRHAIKEGPFPFIVDDILLTFDDDRARAALRCLADLGQSMQVLYFTHHRHIRDMAAEAEFADRIQIRDIS
jgi:uncharacterized protein YhaN